MIHKEAQRKSYLDVLKAIAIIAVVLYHSGFMTYGYLGVDVFLVISGFLTTLSLSKRFTETDTFSVFIKKYIRFLVDRITRLLPLLLIIGSICMIMGYFVMVYDAYESLSQSVIGTNFFANNFVEMLARGDYWRGDTKYAPLMHTWYVGLLMQFYVFYPLLFAGAHVGGKHSRRTLIVILATLSFLSLCIYLSDDNVARRFYMLPSRFFEFGAGGLVSLCLSEINKGKSPNIFVHVAVCLSYVMLVALLAMHLDMIPVTVKLLLVVAITTVLILSPDILENKWTGNRFIAIIGVASYSIYAWHQVVFAFYRCMVSKYFTFWSYLVCILLVAVLSLLSYRLIEQRVPAERQSRRRKTIYYCSYGILFLALNIFTSWVYLHAGVVRDIPELEVSRKQPVRGMWSKYNNRVFDLDKPFGSEKLHWLVIGNSFGRDFVNVISESPMRDSVEVSYSTDLNYCSKDHWDRFERADKIFIASMNFTEDFVRDIEIRGLACGLLLDDIVIVGDKYFGQVISQVYVQRWKPEYFQTKVRIPDKLIEKNTINHSLYGERYLDLMTLTSSGNDWVPVFTEDHKLISSDCIHLTRSGAFYLAGMIDWSRF